MPTVLALIKWYYYYYYYYLVFRYPAINKPAGIVHWLKHSKDAENVDWVVILDADMIIRGPIIPWEIGAEKGRPVAAYYGYYVVSHFEVGSNLY